MRRILRELSKRVLPVLASVVLLGGCDAGPAENAGTDDAGPPVLLRLATTTSTRDSGLLDELLPRIREDTGIQVDVLAVGSGQALRTGADGDADLLLTHAPTGERELVESGAAVARVPLMYNDFLLVGPASDPAGIQGLTDVAEALRRISRTRTPFLSRGDDSGTHRKERALWEAAQLTPEGGWYRETGQGMGATLAMAFETDAVTLVDRATWSNHRTGSTLPPLVQGDERLRNPYALLVIDPTRHPHVQHEAAQKVVDWLTGPTGRAAISGFAPRGEQLFHLLDTAE